MITVVFISLFTSKYIDPNINPTTNETSPIKSPLVNICTKPQLNASIIPPNGKPSFFNQISNAFCANTIISVTSIISKK